MLKEMSLEDNTDKVYVTLSDGRYVVVRDELIAIYKSGRLLAEIVIVGNPTLYRV